MADRKRLLKRLLTAAALLGIVVLAVIFFVFRGRQKHTVPIPVPAVKALMELAQVHQTSTQDGKVQWQLDARSAQLESETGRMILQDPKVDFYMQNGEIVRLTADRGTLDTRNNNMEVDGNVHLQNDRYSLVTEKLAYDHENRFLQSDRPVRIKGKAFDLQADRMTYDLKDNRAQFEGQVQGVLYENVAM